MVGKVGLGKVDKLDEIFLLQAEFDERLAREHGLDYSDKATWIQHEAVAIAAEAMELWEATGSAKWWKNPTSLDRAHVIEELTDILHFLVGACLKLGSAADQLAEAYRGKLPENSRRQDGKLRAGEGYKPGEPECRGPGRPVAVLVPSAREHLCDTCLQSLCEVRRRCEAALAEVSSGSIRLCVEDCAAHKPDAAVMAVLDRVRTLAARNGAL